MPVTHSDNTSAFSVITQVVDYNLCIDLADDLYVLLSWLWASCEGRKWVGLAHVRPAAPQNMFSQYLLILAVCPLLEKWLCMGLILPSLFCGDEVGVLNSGYCLSQPFRSQAGPLCKRALAALCWGEWNGKSLPYTWYQSFCSWRHVWGRKSWIQTHQIAPRERGSS